MIQVFKSDFVFLTAIQCFKAFFNVSEGNSMFSFVLNNPFLSNAKRNQALKIKNIYLNFIEVKSTKKNYTVHITQKTKCDTNAFSQKRRKYSVFFVAFQRVSLRLISRDSIGRSKTPGQPVLQRQANRWSLVTNIFKDSRNGIRLFNNKLWCIQLFT